LRSNTKSYGAKTHLTDSQNSDTIAPTGTELYHVQLSLQAASPETFGYTLISFMYTEITSLKISDPLMRKLSTSL